MTLESHYSVNKFPNISYNIHRIILHSQEVPISDRILSWKYCKCIHMLKITSKIEDEVNVDIYARFGGRVEFTAELSHLTGSREKWRTKSHLCWTFSAMATLISITIRIIVFRMDLRQRIFHGTEYSGRNCSFLEELILWQILRLRNTMFKKIYVDPF